MNWPKKYQSRIEAILGSFFRSGRVELNLKFDSPTEVKQHLIHIRQMQKELRLVKKDVVLEMRQIRSAYTRQQSNARPGCLSALLGKRAAIHATAMKREKLRGERVEALVPYENVNRMLDEILVKLDEAKNQLEHWLATHG
jgi:hypothetical protein